MELPLAIVILGIIRPEDSGAAFEQKNESRLGIPGGKSPRHAPKPLLGEWKKTHLKNTMPYHPTLTSSSVHYSSHQ